MTKISVIIGVYNAEKYLAETIESVINQTFKDWELILVDDGSTDNSQKIAKEFEEKDQRIKILEKENGGRASAINFGLKKAQGEYIAFLDADDLMPKERLEIEFKELEENKDIDFVYGDMERFWEDGKKEEREAIQFDYPEQPLEIMKQNQNSSELIKPHLIYNPKPEKGKTIIGGAVMIRKKIFDSGIEHDENLYNIEDNDLWLQVLGKGYKPKRIPKILLYYRQHANQKSRKEKEMLIATKYINKKLKSGEYFR